MDKPFRISSLEDLKKFKNSENLISRRPITMKDTFKNHRKWLKSRKKLEKKIINNK